METQNKQNAQNTYITLKECLENEDWVKAYELIKRDTKKQIEKSFL